MVRSHIRLFLAARGAPLAIALVGLTTTASAQVQTPPQQACINAINKDSAKVAASQGKESSACVTAAIKGTASSSCLADDVKQKVAKAKAKTTTDEGNLCGTAPSFAYTTAATANSVAQDTENSLFSDVYATLDPTTVISLDPAIGGCQKAVTKALEKLIATQWKEFNACKKASLKAGAIDAATIATCISPSGIAADLKGKVLSALGKLSATVSSKCATTTISTAFPGECSGASMGTLADCLNARARCRICEALPAIDDLPFSACDTFDNGASDSSCGVVEQTCTLSAASTMDVAFIDPSLELSAQLSGSVIIGGGGNSAQCSVQSIDPIDLGASLGYICIEPGTTPCPTRTRHCGPGAGPNLGVAVVSDGDNGACASEAACDSSCETSCGGAANTVAGGCTGHCSGAVEQTCTSDGDCFGANNGNCNGLEPNPPSGICQCTCIDRAAYGASDPGDFQCEASMHITVEENPGTGAPCDGTEIIVDAGEFCMPISTQRASGVIFSANGTNDQIPNPASLNDALGTPIDCSDFNSGNLTGLVGVGAINFFGAQVLGTPQDISVGLSFTCQ